jgi:Tol biopolymer transport system component
MPRCPIPPFAVMLLALLLAAAPAGAAGPGATFPTGAIELPAGAIAASDSGLTELGGFDRVAVSDDGRYVAFTSDADLLDPVADPNVVNVFRKDRQTGAVVLVSRATGANGAVPTEPSETPAISDDGSRVAFVTNAPLDAEDDDVAADVYVRDLTDDTTTLASLGDGVASMEADGSIFDYDLSGDGSRVAFNTLTALDAANDDNDNFDVYLRDLDASTTELVSTRAGSARASAGLSSQPSVSDDGTWVAFVNRGSDVAAGYVADVAGQVFARDLGPGGAAYLVSNDSGDANQGSDGQASEPDIAGAPASGRPEQVFVAYESRATNGADGDTSTDASIHVRQLGAGNTAAVLASVSDGGAGADRAANRPSLSDDGRRVAFDSFADNLTASPDGRGVYLRDLATRRTLLASVGTYDSSFAALAGGGAFVAWVSLTGVTPDSDPDLAGVFGRPYESGAMGTAELVSRPPGSAPFLAPVLEGESSSFSPRWVSGDGRYIVFSSRSLHLPGTTLGGPAQLYRGDVVTGEAVLVSRANGASGAPAEAASERPTVSADGTRVAFVTRAQLDAQHPASTEQVYVRDLAAGTTTLVSRANGVGATPAAEAWDAHIGADGRHVAFVARGALDGVSNAFAQAYLRDLDAHTTTLVSRAAGAGGAIGNRAASSPSPSADGRLVAFQAGATNLDPADSASNNDVFVRNLVAQTTTLVSRRSGLAGAPASGSTTTPALSADGTVVAFQTLDENVAPVAGGWGGHQQIVARTLATGANTLVSRAASGGAPANADATSPRASGDGAVVAFASGATNLLLGVGGASRPSVFARTLATGALTGPPAFGLDGALSGDWAGVPSISDDGHCLAFGAKGHNALTGPAGDFTTGWMHVVAGECPTPLAPEPPGPPGPPNPPGPPGPPDDPPGGDAPPRPTITGASLTNRRFRVGRGATATVAARRRGRAPRAPVGTTIRFTLGARADVRVAIERAAPGRRVGRACRRPSSRLRGKPRCTRWIVADTLTRRDLAAGRAAIAFSGRIGRRALRPGAHRFVLRARNAAGSSEPVRLGFTVVRG